MALVSVSSICYSLCKTTEVRKKCCMGNRGDENTALCHNTYTKIVARPLTANDVSFYWQSNRKLVPCGWSSNSRWWVSLDDCNILCVNMCLYIYTYSNSHSLKKHKTLLILQHSIALQCVAYHPGTQLTLVLIGKDLVLEGSTTKIEEKKVPGYYTKMITGSAPVEFKGLCQKGHVIRVSIGIHKVPIQTSSTSNSNARS